MTRRREPLLAETLRLALYARKATRCRSWPARSTGPSYDQRARRRASGRLGPLPDEELARSCARCGRGRGSGRTGAAAARGGTRRAGGAASQLRSGGRDGFRCEALRVGTIGELLARAHCLTMPLLRYGWPALLATRGQTAARAFAATCWASPVALVVPGQAGARGARARQLERDRPVVCDWLRAESVSKASRRWLSDVGSPASSRSSIRDAGPSWRSWPTIARPCARSHCRPPAYSASRPR